VKLICCFVAAFAHDLDGAATLFGAKAKGHGGYSNKGIGVKGHMGAKGPIGVKGISSPHPVYPVPAYPPIQAPPIPAYPPILAPPVPAKGFPIAKGHKGHSVMKAAHSIPKGGGKGMQHKAQAYKSTASVPVFGVPPPAPSYAAAVQPPTTHYS